MTTHPSPASFAEKPSPVASPKVDPLRLPPLQQSILDVATVDALFRDWRQCTEVVAVLPKYSSRGYTPQEAMTLEQARPRLASGVLLGVQVRYRFEGSLWCDTILRRPEGLTLVRIREEDVLASVVAESAKK